MASIYSSSSTAKASPGGFNAGRGDGWMLSSELAVELFESVRRWSAIDYHSHVSPGDLAADRRYHSLYAAWVESDPYKHRAMRLLGVPERLITGDASSHDKFIAWAQSLPQLLGNPLHDWCRLELQRAFGIDRPFNADTASAIAEQCNEQLAGASHSARGLARQAGVTHLCTSDHWLEDLSVHESLAAESHAALRTSPSLRGDDFTKLGRPNGRDWLEQLEEITGQRATDYESLIATIELRLDRFHALGTRIADHGIDRVIPAPAKPGSAKPAGYFKAWLDGQDLSPEQHRVLIDDLFARLAASYRRRGWTLLLHLGALRETSARLRRLAGPTGGFASLGPTLDTRALAAWLDSLEQQDALPRTILFNLNPSDNAALATLTGSFGRDDEPGYLSLGPAWWYNDHRLGIEAHLAATAAYSLLAVFPGMVSDSRSVLSLHRHEYFRRVLCDWLARQAHEERLPRDLDALSALARRMVYENPARLLGITPASENLTPS